jgi:aminocarboxymuconate-semialdehyde decarboxylase
VEIIDVHAHFVPGGLAERLDGGSRPCPNVGTRRLADGRISFTFPGLPPTRPMPDTLTDTKRAMAWLDQAGIDQHIVSLWSDLFGYSLSPEEGAAWSRLVNEEMMRAIRGLDRIAALATVPIQSGRQAVQELQAAKELGYCGVTVGTAGPGRDLDDEDLEVFWEAAGALRMPVFIHPLYLYGERRLESYGLANAVGRLCDTTVAVSRLLFAGIPLRRPDLAVIVAHGGGGVPYALGRLKRNHALAASDLADPAAGFRQLHFDTVVFEPAALRYLVAVAGADHVMLGSDYPFPIQDPEPVRIVREAVSDDAAVEAILGGNARRVFAL